MNDKKFVNLPSKYQTFLNEVKNIFDANLIKKLFNNEISYDEVLSLHNNINEICSNNNCSSYDINKMINGYDKKNSIIDILKKIASVRNKYIVKNAFKSSFWAKNLDNLKEKSYLTINKQFNKNEIETSFVKLLKKYKYYWDGLSSTIELNRKGNVQNIEVFDLDDFDSFINELNL